MAFEGMKRAEIDLCETCMVFIEYGTLSDWSNPDRSEKQQRLDSYYGDVMTRNLGVPLDQVANGSGEGSYSSSGCEGCSNRNLTVYPATMFYK